VAWIIGWGVVAAAYAFVLVWASGMTADPAAAEATTGEVAGVLAAAPAEIDVALTVAAAPAAAAEEPVVTLALAAGMVAFAGLAYVAHAVHVRVARRGKGRRESAARLVARHITTLM
jgi:hypothetical protein